MFKVRTQDKHHCIKFALFYESFQILYTVIFIILIKYLNDLNLLNLNKGF